MTQNERQQTWRHRHLGWTYILGSSIIGGVVGWVAAYLYGQATSYVDPAAVNLVFRGVCILITLGFGAWALRQKGRSLWWLFLCVWAILFLVDRSAATGELEER